MSLFLFLAVLLISCGYALARGGSPERVGAGLQLGAFALNLPVHRALDAAGYGTAVLATAAIDIVLLAALIVLAWRSTRFWPLWLAGWQFAAVIAHFAKIADPDMMAAGYAILTQIWAYPMAIATGLGAWRHRVRLRAGDPDLAWKPLAT